MRKKYLLQKKKKNNVDMEHKLENLQVLYKYIFDNFAKYKELEECVIDNKFLNDAYDYNDNVLTMKKAFNSNGSANFIIRRGAKISLSEDQQVIAISQHNPNNNEEECFLIYLDDGKVMVVDDALAVNMNINKKKFVLKEVNVVENPDCHNDSSNKEEEENNKEQQNEYELSKWRPSI